MKTQATLLDAPLTNGQDAEKGNRMTTLPVVASPLALIQSAIEKGHDPEQLGKLMDLHERWEVNQAAAAFADALTTFQAKCRPIRKARSAGEGRFKYSYAGYEDVMRAVGPLLAECGIAVSFSTQTHEKGIRVTLTLRVGTHTQDNTLDVPIPAMSVNDTQKYGAALSYAKRYSLCAALNIVTTDEDDDAQHCVDPISDQQAMEIDAFCQEHNIAKGPFLKYMGVTAIEHIAAPDFRKAMDGLRAKAKEGNGARR